jgi:hypothetical protein
MVALALLTATPSGARATGAGDTTTSTIATSTPSTLNDVLVPGDGSSGAESTTSTTVAPEATDGGVSDSTIVWLIVAGLTVVALLVGFLTWRYWIATRPVESSGGETPARDAATEPERPLRST